MSRGTHGRNTVRLGLGREGFAEEGDLSNSKEKRMNIGAWSGNNMEKPVGSRYCGQVQPCSCVFGWF